MKVIGLPGRPEEERRVAAEGTVIAAVPGRTQPFKACPESSLYKLGAFGAEVHSIEEGGKAKFLPESKIGHHSSISHVPEVGINSMTEHCCH